MRHLTASSGAWAPEASVLVANLSHRFVEDTDWEFSEFSLYDLGQAVAHMTVQAAALGLMVRQFRAFDRDALEADFAIPPHWEATTMAAIGRAREPAADARERYAPDEVIWPLRDER